MLQIVIMIHAIGGTKSTEELRGFSYFEIFCLKILYRNKAGLWAIKLGKKKKREMALCDKSTKTSASS